MSSITPNWYRSVIVRKHHFCNACGGDILKGEKAFVESYKLEMARYSTTHYFHADDRNPNMLRIMSLNQIRKEICVKRYSNAR